MFHLLEVFQYLGLRILEVSVVVDQVPSLGDEHEHLLAGLGELFLRLEGLKLLSAGVDTCHRGRAGDIDEYLDVGCGEDDLEELVREFRQGFREV